MAAIHTEDPPNFFDKSILMGAIPFPPPLRPPMPPPDDTTHRFYQCIEVPAKKNVITCTKVLKGTPLTTPESILITIKKGCPQAYDPLTISWKTGAAVTIRHTE